MITLQQFVNLTPHGRQARTIAYPFVMEACQLFEINTKLRQIHFIAQCALETEGYTRRVESLNYSAQGLANTWPGRYAVPGTKNEPNELAKKLNRDPIAIANYTYANRNGNGDIASGDGWNYRGRGDIQTTGRNNYREVHDVLSKRLQGVPDFVAHPEALEAPRWAALAAGVFWHQNGINKYADQDNLFAVSGIVNAGSPSRRAHALDDGDRNDVDTRADWLELLRAVK